MRFSIVIPAFNYAHLLPRALESAISQLGDDYEVLVIDDGSSDNTSDVVAELMDRYPDRFRFIRQRNQGSAAVRNRGIRETTGDYLLFLDADDRLLPDALEKFRNFLKREGDCWMVCGGHLSCHPDGRIRTHAMPAIYPDKQRNFTAYLERRFSISNGATIMSRAVFDVISYPESLRNSEDIPVFAQTLALFECRSFPEPVLEVYKHDDSMRHNIDMILQASPALTDILFDETILPSQYLPMRREFEARNALSVFRALYLAGRHSEARKWFHRALRLSPRLLTEWSHLTKYVRSYVKGWRMGATRDRA